MKQGSAFLEAKRSGGGSLVQKFSSSCHLLQKSELISDILNMIQLNRTPGLIYPMTIGIFKESRLGLGKVDFKNQLL